MFKRLFTERAVAPRTGACSFNFRTFGGARFWQSLFLCGLTIPAFAQKEQWLQYRTSPEPKGYRWLELTNAAPAGVIWPKLGSQAQYGRWKTLLDPKGERWLCLDRTAKTGPCDRLFIDSNGNGRLDDETPIRVKQREDTMVYFDPVRLVFKGEDGPLTYHLICRYYQMSGDRAELLIGPGCYYEGKVTIGNKKREVQLIDSTVNGTFNDQSENPYDSDRVLIDGDEGTSRYLGRWLEVDSQFYEMKVPVDGAFIKLQPAANVVMGQVRVPETISEFTAVGLNGHFIRKPVKGEFSLPAGKYRVQSWTVDRKDAQGAIWHLSGYGFTEVAGFEVADKQPVSVQVGEPIRLALTATPAKEQLTFSLRMRGNLGESLDIMKGTQRPEVPPQLRVVSTTGKFGSTNNMEYG